MGEGEEDGSKEQEFEAVKVCLINTITVCPTMVSLFLCYDHKLPYEPRSVVFKVTNHVIIKYINLSIIK